MGVEECDKGLMKYDIEMKKKILEIVQTFPQDTLT